MIRNVEAAIAAKEGDAARMPQVKEEEEEAGDVKEEEEDVEVKLEED